MNVSIFIAPFLLATIKPDVTRRMIEQPITVETDEGRNVSRMPEWIRQQLGGGLDYGRTSKAVHDNRLHTVCEEARCPNRGECWSRGTATMMLLGDTCTRACGFCAVKTGKPGALNTREPQQVAEAIKAMGLNYVVLTSVNRDDLADGGAAIFADTYTYIKEYNRDIGVEFLTPDFQQGQQQATDIIMAGVARFSDASDKPALVWGHNVETVPRLYKKARKGSRYQRSLDLLALASRQPGVETKSAIMLGLGETRDEIIEVFKDLRSAGVSRIAIGQYLRPTISHLPVECYIHPAEFVALQQQAEQLGFAWVKAGPLVRSSYHADD